MLIASICVLIGFILLMWSADHLVQHASVLAGNLGVSPFLIGVLIIGFGTSAPELFVSAIAAWQDKGNLALGNALGSNITNIGLVLGSVALISSFSVAQTTSFQDIPVVIAVGIIAVLTVMDGTLSHYDGILLIALLCAYLLWSAKKHSSDNIELPDKNPDENNLTSLLWVVGSIVTLVIASRILVYGAVIIAKTFGVGELVIGLTIVAIGTSLPELAAAIAAARRKAHDMLIGNIIGSNVFNTLGVLGITGMVRSTSIDTDALWRDFPVMLIFTIMLLVFALSKSRLARVEGGIMLLAYISYVCYLVFPTIS